MVQKLFNDFLESVERYKACEQYWEQLVREIEEPLGQSGEWQRWIPRTNPDGTPAEMDGNPIFDGRSQKCDRAFRIIQQTSEGNNLEIVAWIKTYENEYHELPHEELVISLGLSEESAELARELLAAWMMPHTNIKEMRQLICERLESKR